MGSLVMNATSMLAATKNSELMLDRGGEHIIALSVVTDDGSASASASANTSTTDSSTAASANDSSTRLHPVSVTYDAADVAETVGEQLRPAVSLLDELIHQIDKSPPLECSEEEGGPGGVKLRELIDHYHRAHPHSLKNALYSKLYEEKEELAHKHSARIAQSRCWLNKVAGEEARQQVKLTNLLIREGVVPAFDEALRTGEGPETNPTTTTNTNTYVVVDFTNQKEVDRVNSLRQDYQEVLAGCAEECERLTALMDRVLRAQCYVRPVTEQDISASVSFVRHKFTLLEGQLKLAMCQLALASRSQAAESREHRHRRNFPKAVTAVLNAHFLANLDEQYPTEAMKRQLAAQCGLSVYQVSNWFGNKRVRYKRSQAKRLKGKVKLETGSGDGEMKVEDGQEIA